MNARADSPNGSTAGTGIVALLERLRRKVRCILLVRGVFLAAGIALVALLAALGTDALFAPEAPALRWGLTLSVFVVALVAAFLFLVRPAMERITIDEIARVLEVRHPELKERLSNALDIIRRREAGSGLSGYSEELLANTLKDAENAAANIRPAREFVHHNWWKYGIVAAAPVFVVCLLAMFFPDQFGRLLARVFDPTSAQGNVYASRMDITPGDAFVREGDPLIIVLETQHLDTDRAELVRRSPDRGDSETLEAMSLVEHDPATGKSRFMIKFPAVADAFEYRVSSGVATSESFRIDVHKWPQLVELKTSYDYPEYTKLEPKTEVYAGEAISAPVGTRLSFVATFSQALEKASLSLPDGELLDATITAATATWQFSMRPEMTGSWHHRATNQAEMETESEPQQMRVMFDSRPSVMLREPQYDRVVAKADWKIDFAFEARDDFGVGDCKLEVMSDDGGRSSTQVEVDYSESIRRTIGEGKHALDLTTIVRPKTRRLIAFIRVSDTRPDEFGGSQVADSRPVVIDIDHTDGPLRDPMADKQASNLIEKALEALKKAHAKSEEMVRGLRQGDAWIANKQKLELLLALIGSADADLGALADELDQQQHPSIAQKIRDISEGEVKPAGRATKSIPSKPSYSKPNERERAAEYAEQKLAEAIRKLEEMLLPSGSMPQFDSPLAQMASLMQMQQQLAFEAEQQAQLDPGEPMDEEWLRRQLELAKAMKQALVKQGGPP